ncbi:hypothetical protein [Deinococcus sp. UYEF24]
MKRPVSFIPRCVLEVRSELQQFMTELGVRGVFSDLLTELVEELDPGVAAFRLTVLELLLEKGNQVILIDR